MTRKEYSLSGKVSNRATGKGLRGLTVRAYDKDLLRSQWLGEATTNPAGAYAIRFSGDDITGPLFRIERCPDLFVRIYDRRGRELYTTECSYVVDAGKHTIVDVCFPYEGRPPRFPSKSVRRYAGEYVDLTVAARLQPTDLIDLYRFIRRPHRKTPGFNPGLLERVFPAFRWEQARHKDCGENLADAVRQLLRERDADQQLAETDADDFPAGTTIKTFFTQNAEIQYTLDTGSDDLVADATMPTADAPYTSGGTTFLSCRGDHRDLHTDNTEVAPTYVQKVGLVAEYALALWQSPPFSLRTPWPASDTRQQYRILKQPAGLAGGANVSWDHVEVGVDVNAVGLEFTPAHELFHRIQYKYNDTGTRAGIYGILREGGARFNVESIHDPRNRYFASAKEALDKPHESLLDDEYASSTDLNYAGGLFWKYVAEQHSSAVTAGSEPAIGVETYRAILEATATVEASDPGLGYTVQAMRQTLNSLPWYNNFDRFNRIGADVSSSETTWGNYLVANYLHGLIAPGDADYDRRFDYLEDGENISLVPYDGSITTTWKWEDVQAKVETANDITLAAGGSETRSETAFKTFAARYYRIRPDAGTAPNLLRVTYQSDSGMSDPLVQIVRLGTDQTFEDLHRSDATSWVKVINMDGLEEVVVAVASREDPGDYTVTFEAENAASDVMITNWHSKVGTEYHVDSFGWGWVWSSPDVMVDTDGDGLMDDDVFFDENNTLKARIRNRGTTLANDIQLEFFYQKAAGGLSDAAWMPVTNQAGVVQTITGASLAAGVEQWFEVDWAPTNDGSDHNHWCVKVVVTSAGDPNTDNKVAFNNFGNVTVSTDPDESAQWSMLVRHADQWMGVEQRLDLIPRGPKLQIQAKAPFDPRAKLRPCASRDVQAKLDSVDFARVRVDRKGKLKPWDRKTAKPPTATGFYYPVDPATLPPGVDPEDLVTLAHMVDGQALGGITYRIRKKS